MNIRQPRLSRSMRILLVASFCLFIALGLQGIRLKWNAIREPFDEIPFNAEGWRSAHTAQEKARRAKMAGDLRRHYVSAGMTHQKITALLGQPDNELDAALSGHSYHPESSKIVVYDMGHAPMDMAGEHFLLQFYFDAQGHFLASEIAVD